MLRTAVVCVSLACWPAFAHAQRASGDNQRDPSFGALTFSPGPVSGAVVIGTVTSGESDVEVDSVTDGDTARLLIDAIRAAEAAVDREEQLNGPMSPSLIDPLESLAELYREIGDHPFAIAALARARQIVRARDGLHSLSQLEIMEAIVESMEELGAFLESDTLQAEMLELAQHNPGDARSASILAAVADRQMDAATDYVSTGDWDRSLEPVRADGSGWDLENPEFLRFAGKKTLNRLDGAIRETLTNGSYAIGDPLDARAVLEETYALIDVINDHNEAGQQRVARGGLNWEFKEVERDLALSAFRRARRLYSAALRTVIEAGEPDAGEFFAIEQKIIETYYFELENTELYPNHSANRRPSPRTLVYGTGTSTLEAHVVNLLSHGASAVEIAEALLAVGDWHLLFSANARALEMYADAHDLLVREGVPRETLDAILSPATPVILAALTSDDGLDFDPARAYAGYVDVTVATGRFGEPKEVELVGSSPGTPPSVEQRARTHAFETRFRPRFAEGHPARADRFTIRYYYSYRDVTTEP